MGGRALGCVLVTGGAGFLGRAILRELAKPAADGAPPPQELRVLDLRPVEVGGVVSLVGDVRDADLVLAACRGVDAVVHAASRIDWGHTGPGELAAVNVGGTDNVLRACREVGVGALVYTSTMDVVCGTRPVVRADETLPYPRRFTNDYARTKAEAERRVLAADGPELATCALRPCGMYGEGDPYHVANVLRMAKSGRLRFRLGDGRGAFQHVYVGNVAHAHRLALHSLMDPGSRARGQSYFVTDDSPALDFFEFMEPILERLGHPLPPRSRRIPYGVAFALGAAAEGAAALCRPFVRFAPALTRSSVRFVCHEHTFAGDKAARDLGYAPVYSEAEALDRTVAWFREQA